MEFQWASSMPDNVLPFTGRGRADDHSNYSKRSAAAVQCSGGLSAPHDGLLMSGLDFLCLPCWPTT